MIKYFCDRCGKELIKSYSHITYSGNNSADLCKECFEEFLNWVNNKPNENYERVEWDGKAHIMLL